MPWQTPTRRAQAPSQVSHGLRRRSTVSEGIELDVLGKKVDVGFLDWSRQVPEPKGPLNFHAFPFQPAIYEAMGSSHREVVIRKGTQVGISALLVRWSLYQPDVYGRTVLYVFPTLTDVHDFSDARVGPMIEGSEYLWERKGDPFNKGLKRMGIGLAYFRGSENKRGLDSVDADCLALDEYDTLNQKNIPDAERRLSGVLSAGLIRRVGVPSLPEFGIAEKYDESDRRKWLVKCSCRHVGIDHETQEALRTPRGRGWQEIDFWENVDQSDEKNPRIVCAGCGLPLDVAQGRWVAQQPSSDVPGFAVSRLIVPRIQLVDIVKASKRISPFEQEVFHNKDLGLPFAVKEARLSLEEIRAAQRGFVMQGGYDGPHPVTMGIDVASTRALNVKISEHIDEVTKRTLWIGEVEDTDDGVSAFDHLALLMTRYRVNMAAIDHEPEMRLAKAFAAKFAGRVYLVNYGQQKDTWVVDDDQRTTGVRRTLAMDATVEMIRRQRNLLPKDLPEGYAAHMTANIRRVIRDDFDQVKVVYEATRPDDYFQSEVYDVVATELWYRRLNIEEATREVLQPLDSIMPFDRSKVDDYEANEYKAGPSEGGGDAMYGPGDA